MTWELIHQTSVVYQTLLSYSSLLKLGCEQDLGAVQPRLSQLMIQWENLCILSGEVFGQTEQKVSIKVHRFKSEESGQGGLGVVSAISLSSGDGHQQRGGYGVHELSTPTLSSPTFTVETLLYKLSSKIDIQPPIYPQPPMIFCWRSWTRHWKLDCDVLWRNLQMYREALVESVSWSTLCRGKSDIFDITWRFKGTLSKQEHSQWLLNLVWYTNYEVWRDIVCYHDWRIKLYTQMIIFLV